MIRYGDVSFLRNDQVWNGSTNTHKWKIGRSVSRPSLWWARGAAGQAAARVLPRLLLVIHKLRLIPVVWCHLHHLPMDLFFNMGTISFHRAFCLEGLHVCYICACAYLFVCACACVLMCLCAYVRENRRESVAMHFYMSSHWSLHMKHYGRAELNTWLSHFPVMQKHFSNKSTESVYDPWVVFMPREEGLNPLKLLVVSPETLLHYFTGFQG